jgi:hypothetical protein
VTAIRALKHHQAAHRDVVVITFRAAPHMTRPLQA